MLKSYLSRAFRGFRRNPLFFLINIAGLSIGISAALVIYLIVQYELDFDKVINNTSRIYRVVSTTRMPPLTHNNSGVPTPTASAARERLPGIETVALFFITNETRVTVPQNTSSPGDVYPRQQSVIYADANYFKLFNYTWLAGSAASSLSQPYSVVLTADRAALYFGNIPHTQMLRRTLVYDDSIEVTVTGVVKNFKRPTELVFREFISLSTAATPRLREYWGWDQWGGLNSNTQMLVQLRPGVDPQTISGQLNQLRDRLRDKDPVNPRPDEVSHSLQRFANIHFDASYDGYVPMRGHRPTLYGLLAVAAFLLLLGCINFVNLTTANASLRAKEIGIRKSLGSSKARLVLQFLSETFVMALISTLISIMLVPLLLQVFSNFIRPEISFASLLAWHVAIFLAVLVVAVTLLAGIYPSIILSRFKPISIMNNQPVTGSPKSNKAVFRKTLSVVQFSIAIFLLVATLVVGEQIRYSLIKALGFQKDAVVSFRIYDDNRGDEKKIKSTQLFNKLQQVPGVLNISQAGPTPASPFWVNVLFTFTRDGQPPIETSVQLKTADPDYFEVFGLQLAAGKVFMQNDSVREYVINETYAKLLGFQQPAHAVGHMLNKKGPIVGVVRDFHSGSTREPIKPLVMVSSANNSSTLHLLLAPQNGEVSWRKILERVEEEYRSVYPEHEFEFHFYDEIIADLYKSEENIAQLLKWATGLCILISCLGLYGLATFVTNSRQKEIGIRKVLGASLTAIVTTLSRDFVVVLLIAFTIAFPFSWFAMHRWLQEFAYRTSFAWWVFALAAGGMLLMSVLILASRIVRTAMANPVKALKTQ